MRLPDLKIRNESKRNSPESELIIKATQLYLQNKVNATLVSDANDAKSIEENITKAIDAHVRGQPHRPWTGESFLKHDEYDATFTIPIGDNGQSVKLSLNML